MAKAMRLRVIHRETCVHCGNEDARPVLLRLLGGAKDEVQELCGAQAKGFDDCKLDLRVPQIGVMRWRQWQYKQ